MKDRNYKKDIQIDESNLEGEWIEQASLFLHYAELHTEAAYEKDKRKAQLDYTYSILYDEIKSNWNQHFDKQPTEPAIKEWILRNPKYKEAESVFIESVRTASLLLNVKVSFDHRKKGLENLVSLKIGGFYSEPKNRMKRKEKKLHSAQKQKLNNEHSKLRELSRIKTKK